MTAERLEELAVWCDRQKETLQFHEITDIADNYADLARCARAWAKVERTRPGALYVNRITAIWFDEENDHTNGPTAIEAVEAAGEATDAK